MDLNYRESDEEVVKIEPNSSLADGQEMTFGLGLDQTPFGSQPAQSLPQQHLLPQQITPTMSTTPQSAKKVSGRVERAARIAELFDAGSPRVRLDHFVYKVDDNPVFDAARVFLDGECQNLVYCCDPKCAEKPTFKRFFRQGSQSSRKNQVFKPKNLQILNTNLVATFQSWFKSSNL